MIERGPRTQEWKDKVSLARGSIFPEIERYAKMRMTPQEILLALEIEGCPTFSYKRVENALNKAWKRGILPRRTAEERTDSRIDVLPQNIAGLQERVTSWLKVETEVESGLRPGANPTTRMDWKEHITTPLSEYTRRQLQRQALTSILPDPEMIPQDPKDVTYLLRFSEARRVFVEKGDRSLMTNLSKGYSDVELDEITERLAPQIAAIRDIATWKIGKIFSEDIIAIESEPDKH